MVANALERVNAVGVGVHCALRVQVRDDTGNHLLARGAAVLYRERQCVIDVSDVVHDLDSVGHNGHVVANADVHLRAEVPRQAASEKPKFMMGFGGQYLVCSDFRTGPSM